MIKYVSSKRQQVYHFAGALGMCCFCVPLCLWYVMRVIKPNEGIALLLGYLCVVIMCAFGGLSIIWKFFDDPLLGKYSFDSYGVTFYTPIHTITFPYAQCAEIGFIKWAGVYIYLSKKELNDEQRRYLFEGRSKKKRGARNMPLYHSEYLLFQYNPDAFAEFVKCVPEPFHSKLSEEERLLNLTSREIKLNR